MREVILAGGFTNGGLNFDAKTRRGSFTFEDIFYSYICGMDTFAHALLIVEELFEKGFPDQFIANRYQSYTYGIGKQIVNQEVSIEQLEQYALKLAEVKSVESGRQEMLENELNILMCQTKN
jgi:xylose isomerase